MAHSGFHFAQPLWLLGVLIIPTIAWWQWRSVMRTTQPALYQYADAHLLPHLTGTRELGHHQRWQQFRYWALLWLLLLITLAGPRWDYHSVQLFHPSDSLLIILDISRSMDTRDVAPSRLARARQEIEDLIAQNRQLRLGLIAFASVPHVMTPITEDHQTLLAALPSLSTDLAKLSGSRLQPALMRAAQLLTVHSAVNQEAPAGRTILLITDGDFDEPDLLKQVKGLTAQGIRLHVLGVGTAAGAEVPGQAGAVLLDRTGLPVRSVLNELLLRQLAEAGNGLYLLADYRDQDTATILEAAAFSHAAPIQTGQEHTQVWHERFYLSLLGLMIAVLPLFWGVKWTWRISWQLFSIKNWRSGTPQ
ncbi:vWA domain-containing protein [Thiospirillum jenense]|uniref:VWA domain-containing protein n=1 Tax=Thiospirillum jenense TaxID=1653858 RepID=A0A839HDZ5_9GAMM|nr:VWA domain-containing protein [Thiospirillum jenense]MBB1127155.1 VWA domain-containing protein [Thiospirillum jenense]